MSKLIFLLLFTPFFAKGQSLSKERVQKIKDCTVRVTIEGDNSIGTGFFIDEHGVLVTCWHVIEPAIIRNASQTITGLKKIFIIYRDGTKEQFEMIDLVFGNLNFQAVAYDFCILIPIKHQKENYPFLKLGDFSKVDEGQEIYTCGYPLGIDQQFISKGIISTKYSSPNSVHLASGKDTVYQREQALLDMTMNPGNSGGPIIKIGETVDQDEVVGIADFIINPIGGQADAITNMFLKSSGAIELSGIDPNKAFAVFTQLFKSTSNGISGCISIDHLTNALK